MNPRPQPRASFLLFLAFVLVQLVWLVMPSDLDGYRRKERAQAVVELRDSPSPVTKAAFENELRRFGERNADILRNTIVLFLIVDAICIGILWKDRREPARC